MVVDACDNFVASIMIWNRPIKRYPEIGHEETFLAEKLDQNLDD